MGKRVKWSISKSSKLNLEADSHLPSFVIYLNFIWKSLEGDRLKEYFWDSPTLEEESDCGKYEKKNRKVSFFKNCLDIMIIKVISKEFQQYLWTKITLNMSIKKHKLNPQYYEQKIRK